MKCFYHHDQDAVGSCKSCSKALCPACAVDLGKGLACRGRCEDDVRALIVLIDHNLRLAGQTPGILRGNRSVSLGSAGFSCAAGAAFLAWGLWIDPSLRFLAVLGGLFLVYGLFQMARVLQMPRVEEPAARAPE